MAGFKTHVSVAAGIGVLHGGMGYACGLPFSTAATGAILCTIGGMLPDMDGDTGVAVREIVPLIAAVIPALMLDVFKHFGLDREGIFLAIMGLYFLIRFGIGIPFKKLTRHRGMWHSIPAAFNVGLICFLICSYQELGPRSFKSAAITMGFLSHLLLDEMWSLGWFRAKSSSGTAFKLYGKKMWPNFLTYGIGLFLAVVIITGDTSLQRDYQAWRAGELKVKLIPELDRLRFSSREQAPDLELNPSVPAVSTIER